MPASGDSPELLKPSEVAARLHVSRSWLYDAAKAGLIPHIRLPSVGRDGREGPLRFVPEDLDTWIAEARSNPRHAASIASATFAGGRSSTDPNPCHG
jgi:hypothetical protein